MDPDLSTRPAAHWLGLTPEQGHNMFGPRGSHRAAYRRLIGRWHPDHNPDPSSSAVFMRLHAWYRGKPTPPTETSAVSWRQTTKPGHFFDVAVRGVRSTPTGQEGFGDWVWAERYGTDHLDLGRNAVATITALPYANPDMRAQVSPLMPSLLAHGWDSHMGTVVFRKDPRAIRLDRLLAHVGPPGLPPEHVAWIVSGLWNIACYLEYARLTHNAISATTVWVVPEKHTVHLWGGWAYAQKTGAPIKALPAQSAQCLPSNARDRPVAHVSLDQRLITKLAAELLGDRTGMTLRPPHIPEPMIKNLRQAPSGPAVQLYARWTTTLKSCFGPRRFVACPWTIDDIAPL